MKQMAYTPKQERNGATGSGGEQQSAQPGPYGDVASVMAQAQAAGDGRKGEAAGLFSSSEGSGPSPSSDPFAPERQIGGAGAMYEWDAGLAINDYEGGGSS
jgi:hypothetical protein